MTRLKITQCTDPQMWYSGKVGMTVPFEGMTEDGDYWSREDAGYKNIVRFDDADLVNDDGWSGEYV